MPETQQVSGGCRRLGGGHSGKIWHALRGREVVLALVLSSFITSAAPVPTHATQTRPQSAPLQCTPCRVQLTREVTLGDIHGPGSFERYTTSVTRNSRGEFIVVDGQRPPQVFDSTGRFLKTIGRAGRGPGEFVSVDRVIVNTADSILVVQPYAISVFSPDGEFIRRVTTSFRGGSVLLHNDGRLLVRAQLGGAVATARMFHLMGTDGNVLRSFGEVPAAGSSIPVPIHRITNAANGGFWLGSQLAYDFSLRDSLGNEKRRVSANRPWFASANDPESPTSIGSFSEDARGLLWVVGLVAAPGWKSRMPQAGAGVAINLSRVSIVGLRTSIIEVVDPATNRILASTPFAGHIRGFVDQQRVAVLVETEAGIPRTEVWRIALVPQ